MALALRSFGAHSGDSTISFLVVATDDLCEKVSVGLFSTSRKRKYRAVVHRCESITEVVELKCDLRVDFVIFAFDWKVRNSISEIEANLNLLDEHFIISGCICLLNCAGVPNPLNFTFVQARKLSKKLNLSLMTRNLSDTENIVAVGEALSNLAEVRLGTKTGIPMPPRPPELT